MAEEEWRGVQVKGWVTLSSRCWEEEWLEKVNQWGKYVKHEDEDANVEILKGTRRWGLKGKGMVRG